MSWPFALYAVAGVLLTFLMFFVEDHGDISVNAILVSLLFGWAIGVPAFVIVLVFFGNWPMIVRDVWWLLCWPIRKYRLRQQGDAQ